MRFLKEAIFAPHTTGAIAPSSRHLARVIVEKAGVGDASRILEIGPGTGVFTQRILDTKKDGAHFVAIERNPNFATDLKSRFPDARIVEGCATELRTQAAEHEFREADSIVSGLPWTIFDSKLQRAILGGVHDVLRPGWDLCDVRLFRLPLDAGRAEFPQTPPQRFPRHPHLAHRAAQSAAGLRLLLPEMKSALSSKAPYPLR